MTQNVLLYGLGAIGSFYGFILSRNVDVRLTVVARSNYDAVRQNGIKIISENHGDHVVKPYKVVKTPAEAETTFDLIVCAHKAINQEAVPEQIAPAVDEDRSTIVIIQNGVGNEEPFRKRFPSATILSCVTWVGSRQSEPGVIQHTKSEDMQVGSFPTGSQGDSERDQERLNDFARLLTGGKTVFQVVPNVQVLRWEKVVWNAAWNSLTTLTLCDTHSWLSSSPDSHPMTRKLMEQVINVGRALGVPLEHSLAEKLIDKILAMPPIYSSMKVDYDNGKPMEVDIILGYPVRKGRELGLDISALETIYTLLTAINKRVIESLNR